MCARVVKEIYRVPRIPPLIEKVCIYCRVSTKSNNQMHSLAQQLSYYVQMVNDNQYKWNLVDVYVDVESGEKTNVRWEYQRMLEDAKDGKFSVILTKSISRFGRNTIDIIKGIRTLKELGVAIIFEQENINTATTNSEFIISLFAAIAEEGNRSRHENQVWAIKKRLEDGSSKIYSRPCYGYRLNNEGKLEINEDEADVVKRIFDWYLQGQSVVSIIKLLSEAGIKSPKGKDTWYKRSIETMLENDKYYGSSLVMKSFTVRGETKKRVLNHGEKTMWRLDGNHKGIISKEKFDAVQKEKARRSNKNPDGSRKETKFTSKELKRSN